MIAETHLERAAAFLGLRDPRDVVVLRDLGGMTNTGFVFASVHDPDVKYLYRIPGEGANELVDRRREIDFFAMLAGREADCIDAPLYIEPGGVKITAFYDQATEFDPLAPADVTLALQLMHRVHAVDDHGGLSPFRLYDECVKYEGLLAGWEHEVVPDQVLRDQQAVLDAGRQVVSHVDAVYANMLHVKNYAKLIDFEYVGTANEFTDPAMWAIYAYYDPDQTAALLEGYVGRSPTAAERRQYHACLSMSSYLWYLWSEYKERKGVAFTDYKRRMLEYAYAYAPA